MDDEFKEFFKDDDLFNCTGSFATTQQEEARRAETPGDLSTLKERTEAGSKTICDYGACANTINSSSLQVSSAIAHSTQRVLVGLELILIGNCHGQGPISYTRGVEKVTCQETSTLVSPPGAE